MTSFKEILMRFHSMPQTKFDIPEGLEVEWLKTAVADYELNVGVELPYDRYTLEFEEDLPPIVVRTLAQMVYVSYLERELSRVMALNAIYGKDIKITGQDATKRITKQELDDQVARVESLLHRQKRHAWN